MDEHNDWPAWPAIPLIRDLAAVAGGHCCVHPAACGRGGGRARGAGRGGRSSRRGWPAGRCSAGGGRRAAARRRRRAGAGAGLQGAAPTRIGVIATRWSVKRRQAPGSAHFAVQPPQARRQELGAAVPACLIVHRCQRGVRWGQRWAPDSCAAGATAPSAIGPGLLEASLGPASVGQQCLQKQEIEVAQKKSPGAAGGWGAAMAAAPRGGSSKR